MWPEAHPPLLVGIAILAAAYLGLFGLGELARRAGLNGSVTRRMVHVGSAAPALAAPWLLDSAVAVVALAAAFAALMVGSRRLGLLGSIHDIARRTNGAELYPIALAASFVLGNGTYGYYVAVLALGLGDSAAAVVGDNFGHRRFVCWGSQRTVEGSAAAAVTTALATAAVLMVAGDLGPVELILVALAVGCAAALGEIVSPHGLDNLVMPLAALAALAAAGSPPVLIALLALLVVIAAIGVRPPRLLARLTAATGVAAIDAPDQC